MQKIGKCSSFQFIQSMEIDRDGLMWMPDNGYVGSTRNPLCPPKMLIMDLKNNQLIKVCNVYLFGNVAVHCKSGKGRSAQARRLGIQTPLSSMKEGALV